MTVSLLQTQKPVRSGSTQSQPSLPKLKGLTKEELQKTLHEKHKKKIGDDFRDQINPYLNNLKMTPPKDVLVKGIRIGDDIFFVASKTIPVLANGRPSRRNLETVYKLDKKYGFGTVVKIDELRKRIIEQAVGDYISVPISPNIL